LTLAGSGALCEMFFADAGAAGARQLPLPVPSSQHEYFVLSWTKWFVATIVATSAPPMMITLRGSMTIQIRHMLMSPGMSSVDQNQGTQFQIRKWASTEVPNHSHVLNQKNRLMARASSGVAPEMLFPSAISNYLLNNVV
jgi:hypothetical protein